MLKAIRNFVRQRSRHAQQQQTRPQVVEDDDMKDLRSHSEVPLQLAEPQLEEPSGQPVWGRVKWYDPDKRYGFVELSDGSGDVFLHATALAGIAVSSLQPGETLAVRVAPGQRGPQVTEVISVDSSTAAPPGPRRKSFRSRSDRQPTEACVQEMDGEVVQPYQGVRVHCPGWQRQGCLCTRLDPRMQQSAVLTTARDGRIFELQIQGVPPTARN
jgi:cold shock CspA family protein